METVKEAVGLNDGGKLSRCTPGGEHINLPHIHCADPLQLLPDKQWQRLDYHLHTEIAVHTSSYR
jgi:hypothetical protein